MHSNGKAESKQILTPSNARVYYSVSVQMNIILKQK